MHTMYVEGNAQCRNCFVSYVSFDDSWFAKHRWISEFLMSGVQTLDQNVF